MSARYGSPWQRLALAYLAIGSLLGQGVTTGKPPGAARKAFERAEQAQQKKRVEEARRNYETAVALYPDYAQAWCGLGLLQAEHDEFGAAMKSFRQAIRSDPKDICPYLPLAMLEHGAGDWAALVEVTNRMLRLDSIDYPLAHLLNAAGHYNLGEFDEAEKAARSAEALDSRNFPKIWEVLGWTSVKHGEDAAAIQQFAKYLESMPMDADAGVVRAALAGLAKRLPAIPREQPSSATFRVDANLALVQFQVRPKRGQLVTELQPEDVEIREDGAPQKTVLFESRRDYRGGVPVEISLLFDCTPSMQSIGAVDPYVFHTSLLDEYENVSIAIYAFTGAADAVRSTGGEEPHFAIGGDPLGVDLKRFTSPTRSGPTLRRAMDAVLTLRPSDMSDTPLFSGIGDTARDAAGRTQPAIRLLVVFSDGMSMTPGGADLARTEYARQEARLHGISIYPVIVEQHHDGMTIAYSPPSEVIGAFQALGPATGGKSFISTATDSVLPNILKSLAREVLPYTYAAGYYPAASDKGKRHEAQVVLLNKNKGELTGGNRTVVH